MRYTAFLDRIVVGFSHAALLTCTAAALAIVALEWLTRQIIDSNLLFPWLEIAIVAGVLAAAFALPSIGFAAPRADSAAVRLVLRGLLVGAAFAVAGALVIFAASGEFSRARSHFFPSLSMQGPFVVLAACAVSWLCRCVGSDAQRAGHTGSCALDFGVCAALLGGGALLILCLSADSGVSLLGQTLWGVLAQDDFLTLVFVCVLVEATRASFLRGAPTVPTEPAAAGVLAGVTADVSPAAETPPLQASAVATTVGLLAPIGVLPLFVAILAGLGSSEALATMVLPALAVTALAIAMLARASWSEISEIRARMERAARRSESRAAAAIILLMMPICGVVLLGLGRAVEAVAIATAATTALLLAGAWRRGLPLSELAATLAERIGSVVLAVFAAAVWSTAIGVAGYEAAIERLAVSVDAGIASIVGVGTAIAALLLRRLAPLTVALLLTPILLPALHAAASGPYAAFIACCGVIAAGYAGHGFAAARTRARAIIWPLGVLAAVILIAAEPQAGGLLPGRVRFW